MIAGSDIEAVYVHRVPGGELTAVAGATERVHGASREDLLSGAVPWSSRVHEDDRERVLAAFAALLQGESYDVEYRVVRAGGDVAWVRDRSVPLACAEPDTRLRIVRDVSEQRSLQEQLFVAQRMEAASALATAVLHDYNNLLMGMVGCANLALKALEPASPARPWVEELRSAALRGGELGRRLGGFRDGGSPARTWADLNHMTAQAAALLRTLVGEAITVVVAPAEEALPVMADRGRFEQVLLNLGGNARDAMPSGGTVTLRTRAETIEPGSPLTAVLPAGGYAVLQVQDDGPGMTQAVGRRVFEPLFTTRPSGERSGLGLSTAYAIVRGWGGHISVETAPGAGSTFTIRLPLAPLPEPQVRAAHPAPPLARRGRVLVVDDEVLVRKVLCAVLESAGHDVVVAGTLEEARAALAGPSGAFDAVVSDVTLPGQGFESVVQALSAACAGAALIFFGAGDAEHLSSAAPEVDLVVSEVLSPEVLLGAVARVLAGRLPPA